MASEGFTVFAAIAVDSFSLNARIKVRDCVIAAARS